MTEVLNRRPQPNPGVLHINPYVPGRSKAAGGKKLYKLSSNETPLGPSPKAIDAVKGVLDGLELYPDGSSTRLREAIADAHGLNPERIICGNGSDELLELAARVYLGPGDEGLYSQYGFLVYRIAILAAGATPVVAPEQHLTAHVESLLAAVTPRTKMVFLANPNNPTGTYLPISEVRRLHAGLPPHVLLVLDAAYAEYVRRNDYEAGLELVASSENVIMTRTFSKIHGLAALRIGWMYGPAEIVETMNRVRSPFNLSSAALAAGAAAIGDKAFVEQAIAHNNEWLEWVTIELQALGLDVTPSVGNFVLVHFPDVAGKRASDADAYLVSEGVVLRSTASYGLPNALRMTIGTEEANRAAVAAIGAFLKN